MVDSPLPTGTLTLLFSDIEGSTSLLSRLGERYAEVLSSQRSILRGAFQRWRGHELGTEGDSFFVVFASVGDAVNAALDAQRELGSHEWPDGGRVRVRMGMHTGEPTPHDDGYVGMDVHRAARIASSAHGGQVVLSEATYRIASAQALLEVSLVDLGLHRLKDLPQLEHLYQLAADGLERQFPPLKSLGARTHLPAPATSIVGREGELRELHELLTGGGGRLVTLTGPGGSGKTRLAIAAAAAVDGWFPDGVYFVALESVTAADVMWTTVAEALGVTGEGRAPPTFLEYLSTRQALLVLDNLEQLPAASSVVEELLAAALGIRVIATARRPLHLAGEFEHPVPPLTLPATGGSGPDDPGDSGAVQLFVQRAQMVRPGFALGGDNVTHVAAICLLLDGLPLAIELAAARVKVLSPLALKTRLDNSLDLATSQIPRPTRHQTLRSTVAWSYELLSPQLQTFFRQLGVFAGDFDLDAAAAVAQDGVDPLERVADLVDVSLVTVRDGPDGEPRVRLLQTISLYARERLADAGELEAARRRHAEHYLSLVETVTPQLRSSQYLSARDRIEAELENVRGALAWSLPDVGADHEPSPEKLATGLRLCQALSWFWYACGYHAEGRGWLARAVKAAAGHESRELMTTLHGLAVLLLQHGDAEQSREALRTCLDFWRRDGDASKIVRELNSLAIAHRTLGEPSTARTLLEEGIAVAREAGETGRLAAALCNLAVIELDDHAPARAIERLNEAIALDRERGDTWGEAVAQMNLVGAMLQDDRTPAAHEVLRAAGPSTVALGDIELTINVIELFGMVFAELGDAPGAARLLGASEAMREKAELPIAALDAAFLEQSIRKVRSMPDPDGWNRNVAVGAGYSIDDALADALRGPNA